MLETARALFRSYGAFLAATGEHHGFTPELFAREVESLPEPYELNNGEVLLAVDSGPDTIQCAGCIAYRAFDQPDSCEIKRLYVSSSHRGQGIGEALVAAAMERALARGYRTACLDTEPENMAAAHRMYLKLGFTEYNRRGPAVFLRRQLGSVLSLR